MRITITKTRTLQLDVKDDLQITTDIDINLVIQHLEQQGAVWSDENTTLTVKWGTQG